MFGWLMYLLMTVPFRTLRFAPKTAQMYLIFLSPACFRRVPAELCRDINKLLVLWHTMAESSNLSRNICDIKIFCLSKFDWHFVEKIQFLSSFVKKIFIDVSIVNHLFYNLFCKYIIKLLNAFLYPKHEVTYDLIEL